MVKVALVPCPAYEEAEAAVTAAVDLLGGIGAFFQPEEKILLKPNLLAKVGADAACTTHPAVFTAAAKLLRGHGYTHLTYGDSPGFGDPHKVAAACGIEEAAASLGIPLADFSGGQTVEFAEGAYAKHFILANGVLESDAILNLCKMKTHMLERITGAQKNIFGCVYGLNKGASHVKFPSATLFAEMLADLNRLVRPRLHIMDAVVAMEGNGPQSGSPRKMGLILASADPIALDTLFAMLVCLDPHLVPTNTVGASAGVGEDDPAKIEVCTPDGTLTPAEAAEKFGAPDFDVYRGSVDKGEIKHLRPFRRLIRRVPKIDEKRCIRCGVCVRSCPVPGGAVRFVKDGKPPRYDYGKCIGCYCCQEMCPQKAIYAYQNPIAKLADHKFKV